MYYNTTKLTGKELKERHVKANTSEGCCLRVMKMYRLASPWQVYGVLWKENDGKARYPITSIRRAMNSLEKKGLIERTKLTRVAKVSGAKEYIYKCK